jgi:uncharacterized SAM-binding protein YcdF (DUF218 family)
MRKLFFTILVIAFAAVAAQLGRVALFAYDTHPEPADAALVLGAAVWTDRPSPVFKERINHAIDLYKSGRVKYLIFTGGLSQGDKISEAHAAFEYARSLDVPAEAIIEENKSTLTYENLLFSKPILQAHGLKSIMIVSDPLHMKRAMVMAKDLAIPAHPSPTPTTRYQSIKSKTKMLISETLYLTGYELRITLESVQKSAVRKAITDLFD